jgi:hypothetical protein
MRAFPRKLRAIMIAVKTSPKGLIPRGQTQERQIIIKNTISTLSITSLVSKNENRDELAFKTRQYLHLSNNPSSKTT